MIEHGASSVDVGRLCLYLLLFADDLALVDQTARVLKRKLRILERFCLENDLVVNEDKTKILVFSRNRNHVETNEFILNSKMLEIVSEFTYVGLNVTSNGSWQVARDTMCRKATKATFALMSSLKRFGVMPPKLLVELFDIKVMPILLYGAELWGLTGMSEAELVVSNFYRSVLGLHKNASVTVARGELGRHSLMPKIYIKVVKYWLKLITSEHYRAIYQCYEYQHHLAEKGVECWAWNVKQLLFKIGFGDVWIAQGVGNVNKFIRDFSNRCYDMDTQAWHGNVVSFSSLGFYHSVKNDLNLEPFLELNLSKSNVNMIVRLRGGYLRISVNEGRWLKIPRERRICTMCNSNLVEDEMHVLFECTAWSGFRVGLNRFPSFKDRDLVTLFKTPEKSFMNKLAKYLKTVMEERANIIAIL